MNFLKYFRLTLAESFLQIETWKLSTGMDKLELLSFGDASESFTFEKKVSILSIFRIKINSSRRSPPEVFLRKDALKICSKFTGEHPCRNVISINHTSAWVFSCRFAVYFQNTFS